MTIIFTDEEEEYLVKEPFNWHVEENAPTKIKDSINAKLKLLKEETKINHRIDFLKRGIK